METHRASDIKAWLEGQTWPVAVRGWDVRVGLDATDDPAVWVWMDVPFDATTREQRAALRQAVRAFLVEHVDGYWPYVRFGQYLIAEAL